MRSRRRGGAAAALVLVAVAALIVPVLLGGAGTARDTPSGSATAAGSGRGELTRPRPKPGHEVYGFVPYWEMDDGIAAHLATTSATTVALFSVTNTGRGAIDMRQPGYQRIAGPVGTELIREAHARRVRVDLTWTSFGRDRNARLFASMDLQDRVIAALVDLRQTLGVDGLAIDVEEIDPVAVPAYAGFLGRLRTALRASAPAATVTVATGAGPGGVALALAATASGADRIFLMGYDYRTVGSEPGGTAPLGRRDGDERSLGWSLDLYEASGVAVERTILGLPLYGLAWPVATPEIGAPAVGGGDIWVPRRNLAALRNASAIPADDAIEGVAVLFVPSGDRWQAIYYDTPATLGPKLSLADERGLAGAGLWALGYERGLPAYSELIATFAAGRLRSAAGGPAVPTPTPTPSPFRSASPSAAP